MKLSSSFFMFKIYNVHFIYKPVKTPFLSPDPHCIFSPMRTSSRPSLQFILLSFILIQLTSCETLRITTKAHYVNEWSKPKRVNRMFWGLVNNKINIADPIFRYNGIQAMSLCIKTPQVIVAVLTLGIYCPINYSYRLAAAPKNVANHSVPKYSSPTRRQLIDTNTTGCHDIKLFTPGFTHDTVFHQSVLVRRWAWGFINSANQNDKIPNSDDNGGVQTVDIRMKFSERLITFLTLGVYCPVTYSYKFAYLEDEYY